MATPSNVSLTLETCQRLDVSVLIGVRARYNPDSPQGGKIGTFGWFASIIAAVGLVLAGLRRSLMVLEVGGTSMEPTFSSGARLLAVRGARVRRGQVVVLEHQGRDAGQGSSNGSDYLVKRLAALPGDPVPAPVRPRVDVDVVPLGQCVALGDNPDSVDSRDWGFVPRSAVVGRVVRVLS
jgi:signal peptidase I